MNKEDIIRMAREAGIEWDLIDDDEGQIWYISADGLQRFAALVADHERQEFAKHAVEIARMAINQEREACAQIAESYEPRCDTCPSGVVNAIRARGNT